MIGRLATGPGYVWVIPSRGCMVVRGFARLGRDVRASMHDFRECAFEGRWPWQKKKNGLASWRCYVAECISASAHHHCTRRRVAARFLPRSEFVL